ncbi:hypothetical protein ILYODFUR_004773 [Ilyodon furcidens]|uniref:Uncharacterized protein n=1 Tax=Ilyodon furcidens TaxID=33524 RepID=A0ABV0T5B0_9TELE
MNHFRSASLRLRRTPPGSAASEATGRNLKSISTFIQRSYLLRLQRDDYSKSVFSNQISSKLIFVTASEKGNSSC